MGHVASVYLMRRYHVQLDDGDAGRYVLLPGDPARCELIAQRFDGARRIASHREYTTYAGTLDGERVAVTSTGIGGPSTAIAVEELCSVGAQTLIRVGTCGSMTTRLHPGDVVIVQAAVRDDGTTHRYVPAAFPAVAHLDVVNALAGAAGAQARSHATGVVVSTDSFYAQRNADTMPAEAELRARWQAWQRSGCIAVEMECSTVLVVSAVRGMRAGAVLAVIDSLAADDEPMPEPGRLPLDAALDVGVDGLRRLIAADRRNAVR